MSFEALRVRLRQRIASLIAEWKQPVPFDWRSVVAIIAGAVILMPLTYRLPMLGYEWHFYHNGTIGGNYPPYLHPVIRPFTFMEDWRLSYALVAGILLMSVAVVTHREARQDTRSARLGAALLALFSAPVMMLLWVGNVSSLTVFSLAALPIGIPLALVQPHITPWAIVSRRQWLIWGAAFGILTLLIWGPWPLRLINVPDVKMEHPIAMGWRRIGWPFLVIGLVMLAFSNLDPLRLMAAGAFLTPYTLQVHLVVLIPALGRVNGWRRVALWLCSWLLFLPGMFATDWSKYLAMVFPLTVWWMLRPRQQRSEQRSEHQEELARLQPEIKENPQAVEA